MTNLDQHPLSGKMDMDSAFSATWSFYKRWFVPMYAISFLMALISTVIVGKTDITALQNTTDINEIMSLLRSMMGVYVVVMLISLLFSTLLQFFIIYKPLDPDFNLMDAVVKVIVKFYLPLLVLFIILGIFAVLAIMFGALLFIVGMFFALPYVMLFFAMATPIVIIEKRGIVETISRLFQLVHKRFWPNMGWISIYIILVLFFSIIVNALIMLPFSGGMIRSLFNPEAASAIVELSSNPAYVILSSLSSALTTPLMPIIGLILYFNNCGGRADISSGRGKGDDDGPVKVEDLYSSSRENDDFTPTVDDLSP